MQRLTIFVGPVSSEKTTRAMQAAKRYARLGLQVVCLRPACSVRAHERPGALVTKNGESFPATALSSATELFGAAGEADIVWIDEVGLFPDEPEVYEQVQQLRRAGRIVLISSIAATSEMEPFGQSIPRLLAVADAIAVLRGDCDRCGGYGTATRSLCLRPKSGPVLVGGADVYHAVCQSCWDVAQQDHLHVRLAVPSGLSSTPSV